MRPLQPWLPRIALALLLCAAAFAAVASGRPALLAALLPAGVLVAVHHRAGRAAARSAAR